MHIHTNLTSQFSDITSPGLSSVDPFTTPDKSTTGTLFADAGTSIDEDKTPPVHKAFSAAAMNSNMDEGSDDDDPDVDEDYDDESFGNKAKRHKNESDDESYDTGDSQDDKSLPFNLDKHRIPLKLSTAEKERSQLKSSTARGDRKRKVSSVSSSTKKSSINFHKRITQLKKAKIQDPIKDFPFAKGTPSQDSRGILKCIACGKEVDYIKKTTLHNHIASPLHKNNVAFK